MEIYRGLAAGHCGHEELIDFLNYVFGMNGADSGFYRLLPKLYKPENRPEDYNYVVLEDGKLRAAVGAYPIELEVAGHVLRGAGIGSVAVHPFHRRKGYMEGRHGAGHGGHPPERRGLCGPGRPAPALLLLRL